jgi:hypothetical protein
MTIMKKTLILAALAVLGFAASVKAVDPTVITLTNVPTTTSLSATNGNTNFSSQAISPSGKALTFWFKEVGTNATTSGTSVFSLFGAPDGTNYQTTALTTFTMTLNGTNPVIKPFYLSETNFYGFKSVKFGAVTNVSTNFNTISWIKVARHD